MKVKGTRNSKNRKKYSLKDLLDIGSFSGIPRKTTRNASKYMTPALSPTNESIGFFSARTTTGTTTGTETTSRIANK
jgi:hypothetical protein